MDMVICAPHLFTLGRDNLMTNILDEIPWYVLSVDFMAPIILTWSKWWVGTYAWIIQNGHRVVFIIWIWYFYFLCCIHAVFGNHRLGFVLDTIYVLLFIFFIKFLVIFWTYQDIIGRYYYEISFQVNIMIWPWYFQNMDDSVAGFENTDGSGQNKRKKKENRAR